MDNESPASAPEAEPDSEIEALLDFAPVHRRCRRHDGWLPERQREFIRALAMLGHAEQAAHAVGGTMSGVYKLRSAAGGGEFAAAWDAALALHLTRYPRPEPKGRPSRGEILSGTGRTPWPAAASAPAPPAEDAAAAREAEQAELREFLESILRRYWLKLGQERKARLEGRIVAADFYVRQLTWLEVALDVGGRSVELLEALRRGGFEVGDIVATPMSVLLDDARRLYWHKEDEPGRPPPAPLGRLDGEVATGERPHWESAPGLTDEECRAKDDAVAAIRAEAQRAWEEKARAEAASWRERVERENGADPAGEDGEP
jgi:hypothetical protein